MVNEANNDGLGEVINEYEGYGLFNDIEDLELRTRNRAVSMFNIFELNANDEGNMTDKGRAMMHGYFGCVPDEERAPVFVAFLGLCQDSGIEIDPVKAAAGA